MPKPYLKQYPSQETAMTPAQRRERNKAIWRKIAMGLLVFSVLTLNPLGVIGMYMLWKHLEPDPFVPFYKKPSFRGKVMYDPRVDRPPQAPPLEHIDREHKDIEF